jgi:hypothetical protein
MSESETPGFQPLEKEKQTEWVKITHFFPLMGKRGVTWTQRFGDRSPPEYLIDGITTKIFPDAIDENGKHVVEINRSHYGTGTFLGAEVVPPSETVVIQNHKRHIISVTNTRTGQETAEITQDMTIRRVEKGNAEDILTIKKLQKMAFDKFTSAELIHQIVEEDRGIIYLVMKGKKPAGYAMLVTKKLDEGRIQKHLAMTDTVVKKYPIFGSFFHDHNDGYNTGISEQLSDPVETIDLHEIGVVDRGYALETLQLINQTIKHDYGDKRMTALVRIGLINSQVPLMHIFGMTMTALQGPPSEQFIREAHELGNYERLYGSNDRNFHADTSIVPAKKIPQGCKSSDVWYQDMPQPIGDNIFIPLTQEDIIGDDSLLWAKLEKIMVKGKNPIPGKDFVVLKTTSQREMAKSGIKAKENTIYLYLSRNWEYETATSPTHL